MIAGLVAAAAFAGCSTAEEASQPPNVIVVMTDDQAMNTFTRRAMPNTFELLDEGTRFTDAYAMPPLCCPARATMLTGQYPHNHGVVQNDYEQLRDKENTLAAWLDEAGYNVGLAGKFLNEYRPKRPAPGFDHWWQIRGNPGYYDYEVLEGKRLRRFGGDRSDYTTLRTTRAAVDFIEGAAGEEDPFFLWASYYAPHSFNRPSEPVCPIRAAQVLPEDWERFRDAPVRRGAAFNEADISDKPPPSRGFPPLTPDQIRKTTQDVRCSLAAVHRVDVGVGEIIDQLRTSGAEHDTVILFISDNGYFFGEQRHPNEKALPYEAALEVPMGIMVPPGVLGSAPVARVADATGTLDLAPTILELAGADPCAGGSCRTMDGRSLLGLMRGDDVGWPAERPRLSELGKECGRYASAQRGEWMYTEWYEGVPPRCETIGRELYDLRHDPHQLDNLLGIPASRSDPAVQARATRLATLLTRLRECNGIAGRDETEDPC